MDQKRKYESFHNRLKDEIRKVTKDVKNIYKVIEKNHTSEAILNRKDDLTKLLDGLIRIENDVAKMDTELHDEYVFVQTDEKDCHIAAHIDPDSYETTFFYASGDMNQTLDKLRIEIESSVEKEKSNG